MATRTGTSGTDTIDAFALGEQHEADNYNGGGGDDLIIGGDLNDTLSGDEIHGNSGDDLIDDGEARGHAYGDDGDDTIRAYESHGGYGADVISAEDAFGDDGNDTIQVYGEGEGYGGLGRGGAGDDFLTLSNYSQDDGLYGEAGNDTIVYFGKSGLLDGGAGDDIVINSGKWVICRLGAGDDIIVTAHGTISGGAGVDTFDFSDATQAVTIDIAAGSGRGSGGFRFTSMENVIGSTHQDSIAGGAGANNLFGGDGDDTIDGGFGADTTAGGAGRDTLSFKSSDEGVMVDLSSGHITSGSAAGDVFKSFENLNGSNENDRLVGNRRSNEIHGQVGDDTIQGGQGADTLYGGDGHDRFVYVGKADSRVEAYDTIEDFTHGQDKIDLSAIGDFSPIRKAAFDGGKFELRYELSQFGYLVQGDINGDKQADFQFDLIGNVKPVDSDFIM